jgi:hypothetical protein
MFLVDDLLLSPIKGVLWVFQEIHDAAQQELAKEREAITAVLSELYLKLETGQITEAEFDAQEKVLLDRLDRRQAETETSEEPPKPARARRQAKPTSTKAALRPAMIP